MPAAPAPTTSTSLSALAARVNFSGCHPRRYSSPLVGFCVQHEPAAALREAGQADVAADALADLVEATLFDLLG